MKKKVSDIIYIKIYNDMYTTIYDKLKNKTGAIMYGSYVVKYHSSYNLFFTQVQLFLYYYQILIIEMHSVFN